MTPEVRLGIMGYPVAHSRSPAMHQAALQHCGLSGSYQLLPTPPEQLTETMQHIRSAQLTGFNVTIPHKETVLAHLDALETSAQRVGAVNCVVREGRGLIGHNTDAGGMARILDGLPLSAGRAIVIGAGGAARASVDALACRGWRILVANRTAERARAAFAGCAEVLPLADMTNREVEDASLLLNATAAGMGRPHESPLPAAIRLPPHLTVIELVYTPLETRLLRQARTAGCTTVDGLALLAAQAADSFEVWTGRRLPDEVFRRAAESAAEAPEGAERAAGRVGAATT